MKICDNGIIRDMTQEEIDAIANIPEPGSDDEPIADTEAFDIIFGGAE